MTDNTVSFELPAVMRLEECHQLGAFLTAHASVPVNLDGHKVEKLGGQAAQLIYAHRRFRQTSGIDLQISKVSDGLQASLASLGLEEVILQQGART